MAKKRHGGLGRGLDALIPMARTNRSPREKTDKNGDTGNKESSSWSERTEEEAASGRPEQKGSPVQPDTENASGQPAAENAPVQAGMENTSDQPAMENVPGQPDTENAPVQAGMENTSDRPAIENSSSYPVENEKEAAGNVSGGPSGQTDSGVRMLRLSQVVPNRSQPRRNFEEETLEELADSIRQFGVLQPILVQKKDTGFEIIAGERRWRACRKAGLKEIPAIVREYSDQETLELSLIENIQREDLNPIEEAKAFKSLIDEFGLRQEDLAARVSKSRTAITNAVRLLKLDERVQDMIIQKQISMGHARALIPVEIPGEQFLIAQQIADKHLSVRDVEKLIKKRKASGSAGKKKTAGTEIDPALELSYREIEERMKQSLGTKVSIRYNQDGKGKMEIEFYSHEDLERIIDLLG